MVPQGAGANMFKFKDDTIPLEFPLAIEACGAGGGYIARFTPGDEFAGAITPRRLAGSKLKDCTLIKVGGLSNHYWNPLKGSWVDYKGHPVDIRPPA